jgi:hypothetical protein
VGQGLSRLLLLPFVITVHLIVEEFLEGKAHTVPPMSLALEDMGWAKKPAGIWNQDQCKKGTVRRHGKPGTPGPHISVGAYLVLGPGVPRADDHRLLIPCPPVGWSVIFRKLQELHAAELPPLRHTIPFTALHDDDVTE